MGRRGFWTEASIACVMVSLFFLLMASTPAGAATVSDPTSIEIEDLEPGENESRVVTISVTGSDNFSAVRIMVTGDTASDEAALQDMVTIYPSYFSILDNSENKTFTVNVTNVGYDGTYTGDVVVSHSAGDTLIPLSVEVGENVPTITGLIPSTGTIVATMTALDSITREVRVYNWTEYNLVSFDAYMSDTQLYGGLDWIDVSFDAPYILSIDNYTTVTVTVDPSQVPDNQYRRTMVVGAYHGTTRVHAEVDFRITIYGGDYLVNSDVVIIVNPVNPMAGENIDISLSYAVNADIWVGATYAGKTNDNGHLTTSISSGGEYEVVAMVGGRAIATETVTVGEQAAVAIQLDSSEVSSGDMVRGVVVTTAGLPVANVQVTLNSSGSKTDYTDSLGRFNISTEGVDSGSHEITTNTTTIGYISYGSASTDIVIITESSWVTWALAGVVAAIALAMFYLRGDLIRDGLSKVTRKLRGDNPL